MMQGLSKLSWLEFSTIFEPDNQRRKQLNKALIEKHPEDLGEFCQEEDYFTNFLSVFGLCLDHRAPLSDLLEQCSSFLNDNVITVEYKEGKDNDPCDRMRLSYKGQVYDLLDPTLQLDCFYDTFEQLSAIVADAYQFRLFRDQHCGFSDTLAFLFLPSAWWAAAEQQFGTEKVAQYFMPLEMETEPAEITKSQSRPTFCQRLIGFFK